MAKKIDYEKSWKKLARQHVSPWDCPKGCGFYGGHECTYKNESRCLKHWMEVCTVYEETKDKLQEVV